MNNFGAYRVKIVLYSKNKVLNVFYEIWLPRVTDFDFLSKLLDRFYEVIMCFKVVSQTTRSPQKSVGDHLITILDNG